MVVVSCRDDASAPVRIVAGAGPNDDLTLVPRASLAEYIEVGPGDSTLLISLSSEARSCDGAPDTPPQAVSLSVKVVLPGGAKLEPGSYPMLGVGADPQKPYALPTAKLRGNRIEFPPGGSLELRKVDLENRGSLEGRLLFEFPGSAERPATRISGAFRAHFCRVDRLGSP